MGNPNENNNQRPGMPRRPDFGGRSSASFGRAPGDTRRRPSPPTNPMRPANAPRPAMPERPYPPRRPNGTPPARPGGNRPAPRPGSPATGARRPRGSRKIGAFAKNNPSFKRNAVLLTLFAALLVVTLIIVAVQSCSNSSRGNFAVIQKDSEADDTPVTTAFKGAGVLPTFAEYKDSTATLEIDSGYGILIDLKNNEVIAAKNADEKIYPASMTKIMTIIVAYESVKSVNDTYTFTSDILDPLFEQGASVAGFSAGETVSVADLIYGAALPSGADATGAIAAICAGSEEAFADLMNEKAQALGLTKTHFVTASGLHDDNHYSTCYEIARILEYAISIPYIRDVLGTYRYTTTKTEQHPDGITLTDTMYSRMSGSETAGIYVQGGKTGYTTEGRHCLASYAANCTEDNSAYTDPQYLMVTAYAVGEYTPVFDALKAYGKYCVPAE